MRMKQESVERYKKQQKREECQMFIKNLLSKVVNDALNKVAIDEQSQEPKIEEFDLLLQSCDLLH